MKPIRNRPMVRVEGNVVVARASWFDELNAERNLDAFRAEEASDEPDPIWYRAFNVLGASVAMLLLAPLLLLGAILVKLGSKGPVFFQQERMGLHGKRFLARKLRTMVVDAEKHTGAIWTRKHDDRIIRFGRFIRKTRLDEIPQLWNVIRGEMNLVGPRPERPEFFDYLFSQVPEFGDRLLVRPGITGWAQIKAGYSACVETSRTKCSYDLYYIRHRSIFLDFRIMLSTVGVVLTGRGAR